MISPAESQISPIHRQNLQPAAGDLTPVDEAVAAVAPVRVPAPVLVVPVPALVVGAREP